MLRNYVLSLALTSTALVGCGGDDSSDGGVVDAGSTSTAGHSSSNAGSSSTTAGKGGSGGGSAGAGGSSGGRLESGTYTVSNVKKVSDDCGLTLEDGSFKSTQVVNVGTMLSIGKSYDDTTDPSWDPAGYGEGSGPYTTTTTATLMVSAHAKISDDGCEFDLDRTTNVTFTGNNMVSLDFTDHETNQNSKCKTANAESTKECTSHYTFDLAM